MTEKNLTFKKNKLFFFTKIFIWCCTEKMYFIPKKNLHIWTYFTIPALTHIK